MKVCVSHRIDAVTYMKLKTIKMTVNFKAEPHKVYEILMDSKKHSELTGSKAVISRKEGGKFSAYEGWLYGKNVKLIPDKKIAQSWRNYEWKEKDHYSTLTFTLSKTKTGTKLVMIHEGVPDYDYEGVKQGWVEYYFEPMKEMLKK